MAFHELINHMYSFTISQKSIRLLMLCMNHSCYQSRNRFQRNSSCKDEKCDQTHPNSILQLSTWAVGDHTKHTTYRDKHKISETKLEEASNSGWSFLIECHFNTYCLKCPILRRDRATRSRIFSVLQASEHNCQYVSVSRTMVQSSKILTPWSRIQDGLFASFARLSAQRSVSRIATAMV
jgi:hypothetical protein